MKKLLFFLPLITLLGFVSCSEDEAFDQSLRGNAFVGAAVTEITLDTVQFHWDDPVDIVATLPEGKTPNGDAVYSNYYYYATGEPFTVVMLYSNGLYYHKCGIYWYDEDDARHEEFFWSEYNENSDTWYNPYQNGDGSNKKKVISRKSDKTGAYEINLPKNTKFGFFQESYRDGAVVQGSKTITTSVTCSTCSGTGKSTCTKCNGTGKVKFGISTICKTCFGKGTTTCKTCSGKGQITTSSVEGEKYVYRFYSESTYNPYGTCQTVTLNGVNKDWTIVGFEDISTSTGMKDAKGNVSDKDFNDLVFAVNPQLNVVPLPVDTLDPVFDPDTIIVNPDTIQPINPDTLKPVDPKPVYENKGYVSSDLVLTGDNWDNGKGKLSVHVKDTVGTTAVFLPEDLTNVVDDFYVRFRVGNEYVDAGTIGVSYDIQVLEGKKTLILTGITPEVMEAYPAWTCEVEMWYKVGYKYSTTPIVGTPVITFSENPGYYKTSTRNTAATKKRIEVLCDDMIYSGDKTEGGYTYKIYKPVTNAKAVI